MGGTEIPAFSSRLTLLSLDMLSKTLLKGGREGFRSEIDVGSSSVIEVRERFPAFVESSS
jgi:hypothetical protein